MSQFARSRLFLASAFLAVMLPSAAALGQDRDNAQDLQDFVYYTNIAKPDLAEAHLRRLLDSGLTDEDLAELVDHTMTRDRFEEALARGRRVDRLTSIVAELETRYREGDKDRARDKDRIAAAIADLTGTLRQQRMAKDILMEAGEYAVPQLLQQVTDASDPRLRTECVTLLEEIGQRAVAPLSVALLALDPQNQARVATMLGRIGSDAAGPYLAEIANSESVPTATRDAAQRALNQVGSSAGSVADAYAALAREFFVSGQSMSNYPAEATNNVWSYDAFVGLVPTPVPTDIHGEVMAMVTARRALQSSPNHAGALATYIGANLKRENDLASGEMDPVFGDSAYTPEFFAMAAGPRILSNVLGLAISMNDTQLIRDAIDALEKTAGPGNLLTASGQQPILQALQYADRRVRYDAALALAKALPYTGFQGDFAVVPALASAVSAGDANYAIVIAAEPEDRNTYADALRDLGYTVVAMGGTVDEIAPEIAQASGIDLAVVRGSANSAQSAIGALRGNSKTSVAPIVVMTTAVDETQLRNEYASNPMVSVKVARDIGAFGNIVDEAMEAVGGRIGEADAMAYSIEAIEALFDIAISNSSVYNIGDAEPALTAALASREGSIRHRIAGVLAYIGTPSAQRTVFDAAFNATDRDQIELLKQAANSARMHGAMIEQRHVSALLDIVKQGGDAGEAAARVHGALNLTPANVVDIISD